MTNKSNYSSMMTANDLGIKIQPGFEYHPSVINANYNPSVISTNKEKINMSLINSLKVVLAENFALYLKAHYYHWNVEGSNFYQMHNFFGELYEEIYSSIDKFAEEIRALDSYAPGSFKRFLELSKIQDEERILTTEEMINQLLQDNNTYINSLIIAFNLTEKENQIGLSNFIQDRIDQHKKHSWMLKSFLKGQ